MATKTKARPITRVARVKSDLENDPDAWRIPPLTVEEHVERIRFLGKRMTGHVQFMAAITKQNGSSVEAKQRVVALFYDRLFAMEQELNRIRENFQLE